MAYVNVKDWSVEQVVYWLKGLDNVILQYQGLFLDNTITGKHLLILRSDDLERIGIKKLGHQAIILEAVELLRNLYYELDKENLQLLALKLSCSSNSLYKELLLVDEKSETIKAQVMSDVHNVITTIKPLVTWLDRPPFTGNKDYLDIKKSLLEYGIEIAYVAHRGKFSENPVLDIKQVCEKLVKIADHIIQEICDPLILQPATLDLATLRKKEQDFGFYIMPNYHPIHQIVDIKFGSPAHANRKIEEGDEIVQINYQTIVGWQAKKVMLLLQEALPEIVLTLKKRPMHSKVYGQIYMKPYRLPSRKRGNENWPKWNDNLPSPRLLPTINLPPITITKSKEEINNFETELSSSDSETPDSPLAANFRVYPPKPRPILQRRNTITGTTPTNKRPSTSIEEYWDFLRSCANSSKSTSSYLIHKSKFDEAESNFLRDKSASCNVGFDSAPTRPTTVIGLSPNRQKSFTPSIKDNHNDNNNSSSSTKKKVNFEISIPNDDDNNVNHVKETIEITNLNDAKSISVASLSSLNNENIKFIDEGHDLTDRSNMISDNEITKTSDQQILNSSTKIINDPTLADINVNNIIKIFNGPKITSPTKPKVLPRAIKKVPKVLQKLEKPAVPPRSATTRLRGKLDKSHSTPVYDLTDERSEEQLDISHPFNPDNSDKLPDVVPRLSDPVSQVEIEQSVIEKESIIQEIHDVNGNTNNNNKSRENLNDTNGTKENLNLPPKPPPRRSIETNNNNNDNKQSIVSNDNLKLSIPEPLETSTPLSRKSIDFEFRETDPKQMGSLQSIRSVDSNDYLMPIQLKQSLYYQNKNFNKSGSIKSKESNYGCEGSESITTSSIIYKTTPTNDSNSSSKLNFLENKVSPTNSIVKAMMPNRGKSSTKKKNSLIAKRRKVTVNDLNPPDYQGFLYQRLRDRHTQNVHWRKRWFVLLGSCLYGFKNQNDPRAAFLIFLSDFTVAVASEVKSRSNAFKVYHTGTVFYFSADDSDVLQNWIDLIKTACLPNEALVKIDDDNRFSETDDSDTEKIKVSQIEKSDSLKKFGSLKKFSLKKPTSDVTPHTGSTSLDRKWFFNRTSGISANSKNNVPVPTPQFRSYRKIKNEPTHVSVRTGNFTSHVPIFGPSNLIQAQNISVPNLAIEQSKAKLNDSDRRIDKKQANYIHASNPSLCNINDFVTHKRNINDNSCLLQTPVENVDQSIRTNYKDEFSISPPLTRSTSQSDKESGSSCFGKRLGSLKKNQAGIPAGSSSSSKNDSGNNLETKPVSYPKRNVESKLNRSLPRGLKMEDVVTRGKACRECNLSNFHYSSDKNFQKKSYEMIYCPETINESQYAQNRMVQETSSSSKKSNKIKRDASFGRSDKKSSRSLPGFASKIGDSSKIKLKSATQYTPMSLPLNADNKSTPKLAFELNLDEKQQSTSKSSSGGKLSKIFSKSEKKEKTFLGSPKLHRALFGKSNSQTVDDIWSNSSTQMFPSTLESTSSLLLSMKTNATECSIHDYSHEVERSPRPTFESETCSLPDHQGNVYLLRKNSNSRQKDT